MGHKITYASKTKFNNALRKSLDENKRFLLKLEKEETAKIKWSQNQFFTNQQKVMEISVMSNTDNKISAKTDTLGNRHVRILEV